MTDNNVNEQSAARLADVIRQGGVSSETVVRACLERIDARESTVHAWTHLNPEHALNQARAADRASAAGQARGLLHGVPVGIKDIIDTRDYPTENGTVLHAGRQPIEDATVVARLRAAGAVILGKTVTTELAVYTPGPTRNPHDPTRTPGGSSSGSAAAVADHMVPLALGSQTNGSVIRPAAYCGVVGFKPSFGLLPRGGMLHQSRLLDHVGVFARDIEDIALLTEVLAGFDGRDPDSRVLARPPLRDTALSQPPLTPRLAFVGTPVWEQAEPAAQAALSELTAALGQQCETERLPEPFAAAIDCHRIIHEVDLACAFEAEYLHGRDKLSERMREMIERGRAVTALDYQRMVRQRDALRGLLGSLLLRYDALLTLGTTGIAPTGRATGNPVFCSTWTLCGVPAITLPLLRGEGGMPLGVQLIGAYGDDARLLRTARWLSEWVRRRAT